MIIAFACSIILLAVESSPTPTISKAVVSKLFRLSAAKSLSGPFTGGKFLGSLMIHPDPLSPDLKDSSSKLHEDFKTAQEPLKLFGWEAPLTNQPVEYDDSDSLVKLYAKFVDRNPIVLQQILLDDKPGCGLVYIQFMSRKCFYVI
jgi:hypothetical protein